MAISEDEWNRMIGQELYNPYKVGDPSFEMVHAAQKKFNESEYWHDRTALDELKKCFKVAPDDLALTAPVYFDHGDRISFGKHFYANTDLTILDENYVTFGDNVFLGPHVSIYTAGHPVDAEIRNMELEYAKPVQIGSDVWIGGNVVINPGVTIGNDVVIGSGAVVTKDIPDHVIAAGNPCRVIREITERDHEYWKAQYEDYMRSCGKEAGKVGSTAAQEMWEQYRGRGTYDTVTFGDDAEADELAALVLRRKKKATTSAYYWVESGEEKLPEPGQLCVVLDSKQNAVCIIKTRRVYVTEFCKVSAEHAALEGEGDLSLDYWRREHRRFFTEDLAEAGQSFSEDMKVVCEEFEKVYPVD